MKKYESLGRKNNSGSILNMPYWDNIVRHQGDAIKVSERLNLSAGVCSIRMTTAGSPVLHPICTAVSLRNSGFSIVTFKD